MEPEKKSLEKEVPFGNHQNCSNSMLNFRGVSTIENPAGITRVYSIGNKG